MLSDMWNHTHMDAHTISWGSEGGIAKCTEPDISACSAAASASESNQWIWAFCFIEHVLLSVILAALYVALFWENHGKTKGYKVPAGSLG